LRRNHSRHRHAGMLGQVLEPCVLRLQLQRGIVAPADFQDKPPFLAVDTVVEVLLAAEGLQTPTQPVMPLEQLKRLRRRDLRAGQTGAMNQRGERHTTTPEMVLGAYIATATVDNQPPVAGAKSK